MKNLYKLSTGLGTYYVIANDPTEAQYSLEEVFRKQDYGFDHKRKVTNIELIAESFKPDFRDSTKPFLSDDKRLFIVEDWLKQKQRKEEKNA